MRGSTVPLLWSIQSKVSSLITPSVPHPLEIGPRFQILFCTSNHMQPAETTCKCVGFQCEQALNVVLYMGTYRTQSRNPCCAWGGGMFSSRYQPLGLFVYHLAHGNPTRRHWSELERLPHLVIWPFGQLARKRPMASGNF